MGQAHRIHRLIEQLHDYRANPLAVDNGIVCNAYRDNVRLEGLEPLTLGAHMRCSTRVCNPVRVSVRVVRAGETDTCACGGLLDGGGAGRGGDKIRLFEQSRRPAGVR
jgi:hypothetical protein